MMSCFHVILVNLFLVISHSSIPIQAIRESLEADGELEASEIETVMQNLDVNHVWNNTSMQFVLE